MTREQVNRVLRQMEGVRESIMEAGSEREERRLNDRYAHLYHAIAPYVEGRKPYSEAQTQ